MRPERRSLLKSALASAAISAPLLVGNLVSPAAAAIRKSAPYVPSHDEAELLRLSSRFFEVATEQKEKWQHYLSMDDSSPEAKALGDEFDALYDEWAGTSDACYALCPSTPTGAAALLAVILERDADFIDEKPMTALRMLGDALAKMVRS